MMVLDGASTPNHSIARSSRLANVLYDIRGPVSDRAAAMERAGEEILKLHVGNPKIFGFDAPEELVDAMRAHLGEAQSYSDSMGLWEARVAVAEDYSARAGFPDITPDSVCIGNGVSEFVPIVLQALLEDGDEVLVPAPDYPLWTAAVSLARGNAVHYRLDEGTGWMPDTRDIEAKITSRTKAIVVINPNNPTGAVYDRDTLAAIAEIAVRHGLVIFADEIYDRITFDQHEHLSIASFAAGTLTMTMSGLSKAYLAAGYRGAWMIATGTVDAAREYLEGIRLLLSMRMCANVPAQLAIAPALRGAGAMAELLAPAGRLAIQRDVTVAGLEAIPGVSVVEPGGALYAFPRLDPEVYEIHDDEQLVLDLLNQERILLVHGRAFNLDTPDHVRVVMLPESEVLRTALERFGNFLASYRQ